MQKCVYYLFKIVAWLPLPILHMVGKWLGRLIFCLSAQERARTIQNVHFSKLVADDQAERKLAEAVAEESLKTALELTIAWTRSSAYITSLFRETDGWHYVEEAIHQGHGLLFITPHLGSYDLTGRYLSERLPFPLTAMYRPPKQRWLESVMKHGRERDNGHIAPTTMQGVRQIRKALRQGDAVVVLPDQVPKQGEGVWAQFFGQPAYTMTLAARLARVSKVSTLFFCGERLTGGRGFKLHLAPLEGVLTGDKMHDAQVINDNVETWVKRFPTQYLFSYNRYKNVTSS